MIVNDYGNDLITGVLKLPFPALCDARQQHDLPRAVAFPDEDFHTKVFAKITTLTRAYRLHHSGDHQLGRPSGSQSGARGFARGDRLPHMQVITIMIEEDFVREAVKQGCISCGILVSGIRARGVSSEHMENMEMFSCSPT